MDPGDVKAGTPAPLDRLTPGLPLVGRPIGHRCCAKRLREQSNPTLDRGPGQVGVSEHQAGLALPGVAVQRLPLDADAVTSRSREQGRLAEVEATLDNRMIKDPMTGEERKPDERFLRSVEETLLKNAANNICVRIVEIDIRLRNLAASQLPPTLEAIAW